MHAIYDYIFTTIILVTMITLTLGRIYGTTDTLISAVSQAELQAKAEEILNKILLTPGDPPDWGTDPEVTPDNLKDFGLALAGGKPYELDMAKLLRLFDEGLPEISGFSLIPMEKVFELLGIKGKYAFSIRILPALNITIDPINEDEGVFRIKITSQDGTPVPNAEVYVTYLTGHIQDIKGKIFAVYHARQTLYYTDYKGEVLLDIGGRLKKIDVGVHDQVFGSNGAVKTYGYVLVIFVRYHNIWTSVSYSNLHDFKLKGIMIGDNFFVRPEVSDSIIGDPVLVYVNLDTNSTEEKVTKPAPRKIMTVVVTPSGMVKIAEANSLNQQGSSDSHGLKFSHPFEKIKPQVTVVLSDQGPVAGTCIPSPTIKIGSLSTPRARTPPQAVTLRRLVWISGSMYYLEFTFWRVSSE